MDLSQFASGVATTADPEQRRLLHAAREEFIAHGFRRTSVGDIARRAKVSRPTIYRRLGDKDDIARAVVFGEVMEFFASIAGAVLANPTPGERAVEAFARGMIACQSNDLVAALKKFEPETLATLVSGDSTEAVEMLRTAIASMITDATLPFEGALRAAELMVRLTTSLLLAPSDVIPVNTDEQARWFATTYFVPLIEASGRQGPPASQAME